MPSDEQEQEEGLTARSNVMEHYLEGRARINEAPPSTNATETTKSANAPYRIPTNSSRLSKHKQVADKLSTKYDKKPVAAQRFSTRSS